MEPVLSITVSLIAKHAVSVVEMVSLFPMDSASLPISTALLLATMESVSHASKDSILTLV